MNRIFSWLKERSCQNISRDKGFATIWYMIAIVAIVFLASFVISEGYSNIQQNKIKTAMNRAVKAATMQYDTDVISDEAKIVIPLNKAKKTFKEYLQTNLKLDNSLKPKEDSAFQNDFQIVDFKVIDDRSLPYAVEDSEVKFSHTFHDPGVMAIVKTKVDEIWGTESTTYYVPAVAEVDLEISGGENE